MILGLLFTSKSQIIRGPESLLIWSFVCGELMGHSSNKRYFLYIAMVISFSVSMSLEGL